MQRIEQCAKCRAHSYHSPKVQTGPHPPVRCLCDWKCSRISLHACASRCLNDGAHSRGAAPFRSSWQRGQFASLRPKVIVQSSECLVPFCFFHAMQESCGNTACLCKGNRATSLHI